MRPVVGFDLDMTLVDSAEGIAATVSRVAAEMGVALDREAFLASIGLPLEQVCAEFFPADLAQAAVERYRALYPHTGIPATTVLPGALDALAAVRAYGGRVLVVSAKIGQAAYETVQAVGLDADEVIGDVFGAAKGHALAERGAHAYVGDHPGDVLAAQTAGIASVAVATGPSGPEALREAGADVVLDDLTGFPSRLDEFVLDARLASLDAGLRELGSVVVAFSGGADSAFLLAAAVRALGPERVAAATAVSPSLPAAELDDAAAFARDLGVRHLTPSTDEMSRDGYRANEGDRCYFCKAELLEVVGPVAHGAGYAYVATGTNADDAVAGFRPGIRAATERGAVTPLHDAGLTKAQVRTASRRWGLPTWDKPAAACLSSRVAYGIEISPSRLARVERAEASLRATLTRADVAVDNLRVRDLGDTARIEVDAPLVEVVAAMAEALDVVRATGFTEVEVDPRGFRSGAMNEMLADPEAYR
ncbi:MAG: ATP-dependent sacrificial sulfur transferase LarE [Actinomycetes bacterium]